MRSDSSAPVCCSMPARVAHLSDQRPGLRAQARGSCGEEFMTRCRCRLRMHCSGAQWGLGNE
jgi:hypothetical protein